MVLYKVLYSVLQKYPRIGQNTATLKDGGVFILSYTLGETVVLAKPYSETIAMPLETPRRSAPASTIASASSLV